MSDDEVPEVLVDAEVNERLHDLQHRLEAQKLGLAEYFQATGTSPDELLGGTGRRGGCGQGRPGPACPGRGPGIDAQ